MPDEPSVIVRGMGCRVWDADGREFIDFRNSLGPITLGYGFPAVDEAIRRQLADGIIFGHPHPLECEVAELLCEHLPGIEKARFLKERNGLGVAIAISIYRVQGFSPDGHGRDRFSVTLGVATSPRCVSPYRLHLSVLPLDATSAVPCSVIRPPPPLRLCARIHLGAGSEIARSCLCLIVCHSGGMYAS